MEGESDEHHHHHDHEKTSVLKKVKAKAKKIKETLTKHGHGQDHDHDHDHHGYHHRGDDHDEEEHDEDEEMEEDPEAHGAPMHESTTTKSGVAAQQPCFNLEKPTAAAEDQYDSKYINPLTRPFAPEEKSNLGQPFAAVERPPVAAEDLYDSKYMDPPTRPFAQWEKNFEQPNAAVGRPAVPLGSENRGVPIPSGVRGTKLASESIGQPKINMTTVTALEEDLHAPRRMPEPSNYQSKVTDPTGTGSEEAGITPILHSLKKMNVYNETESKPKQKEAPILCSGSHDQFSPEPLPENAAISSEDPRSALKSFDARTNTENMPQDTLRTSNQSGHSEKTSSATSGIADKAMAAKNTVASKLGYGGNQGEEAGNLNSATEYGHKIAATVTEKLAPVYDKVAGVSSSVILQVHGAGTEQERGEKGQDKGVSVREYLGEKLKPTEEDTGLSEAISSALHKRRQVPDKVAEARPEGRVTESEEVARLFGSSGEEGSKREGGVSACSTMSVTGKAVVDRLKGAVGSWFSGGHHSQATPASSLGDERSASHTTEVVGHGLEGMGERRLQESGN